MTKRMTDAGSSLLPNLENRDSGMRLAFGVKDDNKKFEASNLSSIETSGPFTKVLEGFITAGGAGSYADLFLLVQPDTYHLTDSELNPVNNIQVDKAWQDAWDCIQKQPDANRLVLPIQVGQQNQLVPLRSIFHCNHTQRFFHPPCPECGSELALCRDDDGLRNAGLPAYSESLVRFIHCPACHAVVPGETMFYTIESSAESLAQVQSSQQLIESFSKLLAKEELKQALPCVSCKEAAICYGPETVVHQRLKPLFFYPFHMFLQPSPTLNMLEFIDFMSGATFDQVSRKLVHKNRPGRLHKLQALEKQLSTGNGLLFHGDARMFPEVLYLKLLLMEEIWSLTEKAGNCLSEPVNSACLDSIWVRLPDHSARLPLCWNFSLVPVDRIGRLAASTAISTLGDAQKRHFLGTVWNYILLVDESQGMDVVQKALDKVLLDVKGIEQLENGAGKKIDDAFDPRHLLRAPIEVVAPHWEILWGRSIALGVDLLRSGLTADTSWSDALFKERLDNLKQEVFAQLSAITGETAMAAPATEAVIVESPPEQTDSADMSQSDSEILSILQNLLRDWPQPAAKEQPQPAAVEEAQTAVDEDIQQGTDTLPLDQAVEKTLPLHALSPEATLPNEDGDFEETVILGTLPVVETQTPPAAETSDDLEKTVVMQPSKPAIPVAKHSKPEQWQDDLAPTVIISPSQADQQPNKQAPGQLKPSFIAPVPKTPPKSAVDPSMLETRIEIPAANDLDKTVVINPDQMESGRVEAKKKAPVPQPPAQEDDLEKTVVIAPENSKGRKPRR